MPPPSAIRRPLPCTPESHRHPSHRSPPEPGGTRRNPPETATLKEASWTHRILLWSPLVLVEMSTGARQNPLEPVWPFRGCLNLGQEWNLPEPTRTRPPRPVLTPGALRDLPNSSLEPANFCRDASRNLPLSPHHPAGTRRNPRRNLPKNTTGPQRDTILVRKRRPGTRRNPLRNPRFFGDAPRDLPVSWCHTGTLLYYY